MSVSRIKEGIVPVELSTITTNHRRRLECIFGILEIKWVYTDCTFKLSTKIRMLYSLKVTPLLIYVVVIKEILHSQEEDLVFFYSKCRIQNNNGYHKRKHFSYFPPYVGWGKLSYLLFQCAELHRPIGYTIKIIIANDFLSI